MTTPQIQISDIVKSYNKQGAGIPVLNEVSLRVEKGDFVVLLGKSGSGKSSLLNIIGLLDDFDKGNYLLYGEPVVNKNETRLAGLRNKYIGFIFQSYNLLPHKTALENVALPLFYRRIKYAERMQLAAACLEKVGMKHRADHYPAELSGGECQRVAVARALIGNPHIILADEPTGALDSSTGKEILSLFTRLNTEGITIIMVTHDEEIARSGRTILRIQDGKFAEV